MAKQNIIEEMDWDAMDRMWAEQYEKDYGNLFCNTNRNSRMISISVSNNLAS